MSAANAEYDMNFSTALRDVLSTCAMLRANPNCHGILALWARVFPDGSSSIRRLQPEVIGSAALAAMATCERREASVR